MATPDWRARARDIFFQVPHSSAAELPALLRRSKTLGGEPHEIWKHVAFDWLQSLSHPRANATSAGRRLEGLNALLSAGVDPNAGAPTFVHLPQAQRGDRWRAYFQVARASARQNDNAARLQVAAPFRGQSHFKQYEVSWLARTCWAGRNLPDLPALLKTWMAAGGNPHGVAGTPDEVDENETEACDPEFARAVQQARRVSWSAWPFALCSGRLDVCKTLRAGAPEGRPNDWVGAVLAALEYVRETNPQNRMCLWSALEWFTEAFPPTAVEREAVWQGLVGQSRIKSGFGEGVLMWMSLPVAGLGEPAPQQPQARPAFNPWAVLGHVGPGMENCARAVLERLLAHPHWGCAAAIEACAASSSSSWSTLPATANIATAWLVEESETRRAHPDGAQAKWRKTLLAAMDELGVRPSPDLAEALAAQHAPPDAAAEAWLKAHRDAWGGTQYTPWRFAPAYGAMRAWLTEHAPSPSSSDLAAAVASYARRKDEAGLAWAAERLREAPGAWDWEALAQGWTLGQWVNGTPILATALPATARTASAHMLAPAMNTLTVAAVDKALAAWKGSIGPELSARLLDHWATLLPAEYHARRFSSNDAPLSDDKVLLTRRLMLQRLAPRLAWEGPMVSPEVFVRAFGCFNSTVGSPRSDLVPLFDRLCAPDMEWTSASRRALVKWMHLSLCQAVRGEWASDEPLPWSTPGWKALPAEKRSGLGRALLAYAFGKNRPQGTTYEPTLEFLGLIHQHCFDGAPAGLTEGASPEGRKYMNKLMNGPIPEMVRESGRPAPVFFAAWAARLRQGELDKSLAGAVEPTAARRLRM